MALTHPKYLSRSSFPAKEAHVVGNIDMFLLLKFENKVDTVVSHIHFNSKHYYKCIIASQFI